MDHSIDDFSYEVPKNNPNKPVSYKQHSLIERIENIMSLSQLLRFIGAISILASMSLFMFKGWSDGNDIGRYLKLLAQTGMITGAGLILSFVVKEAKGARVFFGLGLASVVANFTILGALTYSLFPIDSNLMEYPSMIKWEVATLTAFVPTFIGALVLLSIVAFFGFSVFARKFAKPMTLGFLLLSALLLVPLRAPVAAAIMAAIALAGAWYLIQRLRQHEAFLATFEIKVAFSLLLLPGVIIAVRALSFYNLDDFSLMAFTVLGFGIIKTLANSFTFTTMWARVANGVQLVLGIVIAFLLSEILPELLNLYNYGFEGTIIACVIIAFTFEQLVNGKDKRWSHYVVSSVTTVLVPVSLLSAIGFDSHEFQSLIVAGLVLALNIMARNVTGKRNFSGTLAALGFAVAMIIALFNIVELIQLSNWVIVGIIGGVFIVGASLYDRYGLRLIGSQVASEV